MYYGQFAEIKNLVSCILYLVLSFWFGQHNSSVNTVLVLKIEH